MTSTGTLALASIATWMTVPLHAFIVSIPSRTTSRTCDTKRWIRPPPGSGYAGLEDEQSEMPDSYIPMMEYPGTMRPGRTPDNAPFHDLPLDDDDTNPVPWPHFQEIEWHHRWEPPNPHPVTIEDFIEQEGRWATPEMEAKIRAGNRKNIREQSERQKEDLSGQAIIDDDEDDDDDEDLQQDLGEGMFGSLGSSARPAESAKKSKTKDDDDDVDEEDEDEEDDSDESGLDDFLLDLGLDADDEPPPPVTPTKRRNALAADTSEETEGDLDDEDNGESAIEVDEDDELDLGLDDDDDELSSDMPLEDYDSEDDALGQENFFDDAGFDFDDGGDGGDFGGDEW